MSKLLIPKDYFYKGSPEQEIEITRESIDRMVENARKVFGPDFMADHVTEAEANRPKN